MVGATVLRIKTQTLTLLPEVTDQPIELPGPDQISAQQPEFSSSPFVTGISMRAVVAADFCNATAATLDFR